MPELAHVQNIRLGTKHVLSFGFGEFGRIRIESVYLFQRKKTTNGQRLVRIVALVIIKIHMGGRGKDHIVAFFCCIYGALHSTPRHHRGIWG